MIRSTLYINILVLLLSYLFVKRTIMFMIKCFECRAELGSLCGNIQRKITKGNSIAVFRFYGTEELKLDGDREKQLFFRENTSIAR